MQYQGLFQQLTHKQIPEKDIHIENAELIDPAIISRVVIHANGKVNACHEGWRGKWVEKDMATFGNINETSFNDIWTGEKRRKFIDHIIEAHRNGENEFGCCAKGEPVCAKNCKYDGFNTVQKWIISQMEQDKDSTFFEINVPSEWAKDNIT